MSALKASPAAPSSYLRSKGEAEKLIRDQNTALDWTIFQPSAMFGPGDSFLNRFAGLLAAIPGVFPLARPNAKLQPVWVNDVVDALVSCLHGGASSRQTYELGGPQVYTRREVVSLVATLTGRRRWIIGLPGVPGVDSVCKEDGFAKLGIAPKSMAASARLFLGSEEDNARLSQNRAAAGRAKSAP
jgi:NADH dehydrogenase